MAEDNISIRKRFLILFISIQVIKISHFFNAFKTVSDAASAEDAVGFSSIAFWCFVDGSFFWLLRRFIRPRLNLLGIVLLSLAMFGLNTGFIAALSASTQSLLVSKTTSNDAKGSSMGHGSRDQDSTGPAGEATLQEIGSHTVKVRPPIRAKLNPNTTNFCYTDKSFDLNDIIIPMMVKGSPPFYIDFNLVSSTSMKNPVKIVNQSISSRNEVQFVESPTHGQPLYKSLFKDSKDEASTSSPEAVAEGAASRKVALYGIKPDFTKIAESLSSSSSITFEILALRDQRGDSALIVGNKKIVLVQCPRMKWIDTSNGLDLCVDEKFSASVEAEGILPLSVLYIVRSGNNERIESVELGARHENDLTVSKLSKEIKGKVEGSNVIAYKLLRVTDGLNNSVQFSSHDLTNSILPPVHAKSTNKIFEETEGDSFSVIGHSAPSASFGSCNNVKIRTVYDAQFQKAPTANIPVAFEGDAPFSLLFEFLPDSGAPAQPYSMTNIQDKRTLLTAHEPGSFVLVGVEDKFCKAKIPSSSKCVIQPVLPPSFAFTSSPIEESCFGAVGANVDLSFTGEGPFWLEYTLEKTALNGGDQRVEKIPHDREVFRKNRASLVLKPKEPGIYRYVFDRVGDKNYNDGMPILESSLTQIIHPHSSAFFVVPNQRAPYSFIRCKGQTVDLQVAVQGSGPWIVTYEVTHTKRVRTSVQVDEKERGFKFAVDELNEAGIYSVDLIEIKDGNGCNVKLQTDSVLIEVLPSRPSVSFSSDKPVFILENGVASLPISLSGRGPFNVGVKYADGTERILRLAGSTRFIDFPGTGTHQLVSISDSVCDGQVEGTNQVQVYSFPRPSMELPNDLKKTASNPDVCLGVEANFQINLHGKAPFKVVYSTSITPVSASGRNLATETRKFTETIDTFFLRLAVNSSIPGLHKYTFTSLSDDNYKTAVRVPEPIVFSQRIHPIPKASFLEPEQRVFHCASAAKGPYRLRILLQGSAPFSVKVEQKRDSQHIGYIIQENIGLDQLEKIDNAGDDNEVGYIWEPQTKSIDGMGKHEFIMLSVSDRNGCSFNFDSSEPVSTFFEIADQARIHTFNPTDVCVGDLLSYTLQGTPPFTIGYSWQGVAQPEITVADPMLSLWVGAPGTVVITKICNSADCCDENVSSDLSLTTRVHPLPRAVVGSGDDSFDDIKEGDESSFSVDFEGTAPFSFTYVRSRGSGSKSAVKEELFTVSDITDNHWSINTSQEGTFRVKSVQDRFCAYPRRLASTKGANRVLM